MQLTSAPIRRLKHFTPLRYPGGKGWLAAYVKAIIKTNKLYDQHYVEPYCGGAAVGLELLFHEYVSEIHINDLSRPVFAFWKSVIDETNALSKLVTDVPLTMSSWDRQKKIFQNPDDANDLELGFATFFLNRTNRSGIFNAGAIGGRNQTGKWKIDARFNREELVFRIESIARLGKRIHLTTMDALKFLEKKATSLPARALIYLDPPYYVKGRDLYYDFYEPHDHKKIQNFLTGEFANRCWVISYDNVPPIRNLYRSRQRLVYQIGYSAREARAGSEVMFFSDELQKSPLVGKLKLLERFSSAAAITIDTAPKKRLGGATR